MNTASQALNQFLLALCVWREARGESLRGKQLVAWTILNRSHDKRWPNTIRGVVLQPLQFSSFNANDPNSRKLLNPAEYSTPDVWKACYGAAAAVFFGLTTDPTGGADHYRYFRHADGWISGNLAESGVNGHILAASGGIFPGWGESDH